MLVIVSIIVIVAVFAQVPEAGVNVYVTEPALAVLMAEGLHVPKIPSFEVVGKLPGVWF